MTVIGEVALMIVTGMGAIKVMDIWDKKITRDLHREERKALTRERRYDHPHHTHHTAEDRANGQ